MADELIRGKNKKNKIKHLVGRFFTNLDKQMAAKAKGSPCCCSSDKRKKTSCCS